VSLWGANAKRRTVTDWAPDPYGSQTALALASQDELTVSGRGAPDSVRFGLDPVCFSQGELGRRQVFGRFYGAPNATHGRRDDAAPALKSPVNDPADTQVILAEFGL
jgi:hypothetical protein